MSDKSLILDLVVQLERLASELQSDIDLCKTREEHIRVTARANDAARVASDLRKFFSNGEPIGE